MITCEQAIELTLKNDHKFVLSIIENKIKDACNRGEGSCFISVPLILANSLSVDYNSVLLENGFEIYRVLSYFDGVNDNFKVMWLK